MAVCSATTPRRLLSERRRRERRMHLVGRPLIERPPMHHRALRRAIPAAATLLGLAALAAPPTYAAAPAGGGGGVIVPAVDVDYNTAAISLSGFPAASAETITVVRDGVTVATGTGTTTGAADPAGAGLLLVNVPNIVAPEPLACWTGFTPDILPGDTVTVTD